MLSPYYGWVIERLVGAIQPDTSQGEAPEVPRYETSRGPGSTAEVDYWTSREVREVTRSHLNYVVADTAKWERQAAQRRVEAVSAEGSYGCWRYKMVKNVAEVSAAIARAATDR